MKKIGTRLGYWILLGVSKAIGALPYRVMYYGLVPVIYFVIYKIFHYRKKVVMENLRNAFPEKSEAELKAIKAKFYRHLSEIFIDTMVLSSISERKLRQRFRFLNHEAIEKRMNKRTWICAMAHYGSWEYASSYKLYTDHQVAGVYRPLHNEVFNQFYIHTRSRFGSTPVAMNELPREIIRAKRIDTTPMAIALIADQSPHWFSIRHWFSFLNQPTAFFPGTEKLALKFHLPICFLEVQKIKPGYYTAEFVEIYDGQETVAPYEITERYARQLEAMIRRHPELWLWSHKRWKHKPTK